MPNLIDWFRGGVYLKGALSAEARWKSDVARILAPKLDEEGSGYLTFTENKAPCKVLKLFFTIIITFFLRIFLKTFYILNPNPNRQFGHI